MAVEALFSRRSTVTYLNADGRRLTAASSTRAFNNPCDSTVRVGPRVLDGTKPDGIQERQLHIAYAGNYDPIMTDFIDAHIVQRLSMGVGELIVAKSSRSDLQGLVLWRGPYHEIAGWVASEEESEGIADPVTRFDGLQFTDSEEGLLVEPTTSDLVVQVLKTVTDIDGIGTLFMSPAELSLERVPAWKGTTVRVGEIWKSEIKNSAASPTLTTFTIATPTVVAVLASDPNAKAPFTEQLKFLESLNSLSLTSRRAA